MTQAMNAPRSGDTAQSVTRSPIVQALGLAGWLAVSFAAGGVGAVASVDAGSFYGELVRPAWAPPAWLFGPVWSALYASMGVAAWLAWRAVAAGRARGALTLYLAQLIANALWSWLFFAWREGGLAFADLLLLWALIAATLVAFWRIKPIAGGLLVPYLAWVSFAGVLNWTLWIDNRALLGG